MMVLGPCLVFLCIFGRLFGSLSMMFGLFGMFCGICWMNFNIFASFLALHSQGLLRGATSYPFH